MATPETPKPPILWGRARAAWAEDLGLHGVKLTVEAFIEPFATVLLAQRLPNAIRAIDTRREADALRVFVFSGRKTQTNGKVDFDPGEIVIEGTNLFERLEPARLKEVVEEQVAVSTREGDEFAEQQDTMAREYLDALADSR